MTAQADPHRGPRRKRRGPRPQRRRSSLSLALLMLAALAWAASLVVPVVGYGSGWSAWSPLDRTIPGSLVELLADGRPLLALVVFMTAVALPATKLVLALRQALGGRARQPRAPRPGIWRNSLAHHLSQGAVARWTLTELFIIAVLLAILTLSDAAGLLVTLDLKAGFYLFLTHGVLVLIASSLPGRPRALDAPVLPGG